MSSLDEMEGETLETVLLVTILGIIVIAAWFFFKMKGQSNTYDFMKWATELVAKFWKWLTNMLPSGSLPTATAGYKAPHSTPGPGLANDGAVDVQTENSSNFADVGSAVPPGTTNAPLSPSDYTDAANAGGSQ